MFLIKSFKLICALLLMLALTACGSNAKVNQFQKFSQAGLQYYQAVNALADEAAKTRIEKDTRILVSQRDKLSSESDRQLVFDQTSKITEEYLAELQKFRLLTTRMQRYFSGLSKLSKDDLGANFSASLNQLAGQISDIKSLGEADANGMENSKASLVSNFILGNLQNAALKKQLKDHGKELDLSLGITARYVNQLIDYLNDDANGSIALLYRNKVVKPYVEKKALPKTWKEDRNVLEQLRAQSELAETVKKSSEDLRKMYLAISKKETALEETNDFLIGVNDLLTFLEMLKAS